MHPLSLNVRLIDWFDFKSTESRSARKGMNASNLLPIDWLKRFKRQYGGELLAEGLTAGKFVLHTGFEVNSRKTLRSLEIRFKNPDS
ncbi:hypothetical protein CEXT_589341 [Caerostris extrusa]|uniref:LAGLIDADG homing endonuclease n=1 Tax=Caerostris extrusa TaxID=172846 RepID=A0AAV4XES5_CAEEX|nr:hypothetical protein CEXT_589341 [Caerostris extrusa]